MPLFEVTEDELIQLRRVQAGPELYEAEIEALLWSNLDSFVGVPLFPVARQPKIGAGLRPDIVAIDGDGHVHVIEVKRDIDRGQLAQSLEYAGWARNTNLDELAGMFHGGTEAFFAAWAEFTGTAAPRLVQLPPQLVLVAGAFDDRTDGALSFLMENGLPVTVLPVTIYRDQDGRRFVDVGADHELELPEPVAGRGGGSNPARFKFDGRRLTVGDLLNAGLLEAGAALSWTRPKIGRTYSAKVLETGQIQLDDGGRVYASPSRAAKEAAGVVAYDGWQAWCTSDGKLLAELREQLLASNAPTDEVTE